MLCTKSYQQISVHSKDFKKIKTEKCLLIQPMPYSNTIASLAKGLFMGFKLEIVRQSLNPRSTSLSSNTIESFQLSPRNSSSPPSTLFGLSFSSSFLQNRLQDQDKDVAGSIPRPKSRSTCKTRLRVQYQDSNTKILKFWYDYESNWMCPKTSPKIFIKKKFNQ